ncbi:hypothetical protein PHMEG_0009829 [Phytophthora megakarya]|uniref:No apical meristem-associated C-terminal domain-containing protein n=1 Tax=Phytophthora megakarya TaxID=4795 RepID=A0A225WF79_9STRA|nr:hypothetical protein PHMEG_0009829 [Phytophthora megakarya]
MYEVEQDEQFDFLEAWRELRHEPKWKALPDARSSRKRSSNHGEEHSTDTQTHGLIGVLDTSCKDNRPVGIKKQKAARSHEMSNQQLADAAVEISRSSQRKTELDEQRLKILEEREQNRIIFASLDGLDELSARILKIKKENILKQLQDEVIVASGIEVIETTSENSATNNTNPTADGMLAMITFAAKSLN